MCGPFELRFPDDPDYEDLLAEMYIDDEFVRVQFMGSDPFVFPGRKDPFGVAAACSIGPGHGFCFTKCAAQQAVR